MKTRLSINGRALTRYPLVTRFCQLDTDAPGRCFSDWDLFSVLFYYWLESAVGSGLQYSPDAHDRPGPTRPCRCFLGRPEPQDLGIILSPSITPASWPVTGSAYTRCSAPVFISPSTVIMGIVSLSIGHGVLVFRQLCRPSGIREGDFVTADGGALPENSGNACHRHPVQRFCSVSSVCPGWC